MKVKDKRCFFTLKGLIPWNCLPAGVVNVKTLLQLSIQLDKIKTNLGDLDLGFLSSSRPLEIWQPSDCAFRLGIFFSGPSETQSRESNKQQAAHPNRGSNYTQKHSFSKDTLLIKKMSDDPPPYSKSPFPYSKLVEESAPPEDELCMMPPSQPPSATEFHHHHHHHHEQPPPPPQNYLPTPQQDSYPQQPSAPVINVFQQPQPAVGLVVATAGVPPGICTVCRIGKIKNTASFWSWVCCICCLPFGIIPGIIAFYYVNRKPKCNNCGFTI
ncbi:uncharacterized protein [Procambarus clarkii]|uniref:uncharacterized protein isoform X2 n=1 Tax=Procambarus clarkii TaxID=6728 RepID=UPI001E6702EC|nr:uncharacterized protein LOC123764419 isoform X2 [Procambarus clarkii]